MKKLLFLFLAVVIVGCGNQNEQDNSESKPTNEEETNTQVESGSSVSVNFRKIDVTSPEQKIIVKGEAMATNDKFYFTLKYGDTVVVKETEVTLDTDKSGWGSFQLEIDAPKSSETEQKVPVLTFYVKNDAGKIINPNYIPVDLKQ